jgi:hypothetical protein
MLPFLNEQTLLGATCRSLGFGRGVDASPQNTTLFLIDNASTDESLRIAKEVQQRSAAGSVVLGMESERGYVPPRHLGALIAQKRQTATRSAGEPLLILQVDADTFYRPGYLAAMRRAAESAGPNVLLDARTEYPLEFVQQHPDYLDLCNAVDRSVDRWFAPLDRDVIVDDKVSAYFLSDYFAWGGHQREYSLAKNEIHAETSRLYLRAKARKAMRCQVDSATAEPSMRRLFKEPSLQFATAGFPREDTWSNAWQRNYDGPKTLVEFYRNISHPAVQRAIRMRKMHLLALFAVLPLHVSRCLKEDWSETSDLARLVLPILPQRDAGELQRPGILLTDVFELINDYGDYLLSELRVE